MSFQKTDKEVDIMKTSGKIAAEALKKVLINVREGITLRELDSIAEKEIRASGATPSFMTVDNYKWTICTTVNEAVVHGIPGDRKLKDGDILGVDIGALYNGFHSDLAITVPVGKVALSTQKFLKLGAQVLGDAIKEAKVGRKIGDISHTIQKGIESQSYSIVKSLTGHGVGRSLHEDPMIPGFGKAQTGPTLKQNMTIAIEIIYAQGSGEVELESNNWTITTKDKSLGGLFEQTVLVDKGGPIVLTPYL